MARVRNVCTQTYQMQFVTDDRYLQGRPTPYCSTVHDETIFCVTPLASLACVQVHTPHAMLGQRALFAPKQSISYVNVLLSFWTEVM